MLGRPISCNVDIKNNSLIVTVGFNLVFVRYHEMISTKVILLGESGTGKTSIALRFVSNEFRPYSEATIGASFFEKTVTYEDDQQPNKKRKVLFNIWDTAGQEKYHALASMYYRGAGAAILVYDISRPSSFLTMQEWARELQIKGPPDIKLVVCGNKLDLEASGDRKVLTENAKEYADEIGAFFMEASARDDTNY